MKNILFISVFNKISGAERSLLELLENHKDENWGKHLVSNGDLNVSNNLILLKYQRIKYITQMFNPVLILLNLLNILRFSITIAFYCIQNRISIIHSNTIKSNLYGIGAKLFTGKKLIWHIRDNLKDTLLEKYMLRKSNKVICISKHIYDQVKLPNCRKELVYGGINLAEWKPKILSNEFRKKYNLPENVLLIAQVSQLTPWKNHSDFINAAKIINQQFHNVHFLVAGDCLLEKDLKYKNEIIRQIEESGLKSKFSLLGNIKYIQEIYSIIDILVHPAINEPFGRVLIEALALEKPVVAYNCGGPREIITNNETGFLVEPNNYQELANKTMDLLKDNQMRDRFGTAGRARVNEKFNIERYVAEMEAVFNEL